MPQNPSRLSSKRLRCSANRVRAWSGGQVTLASWSELVAEAGPVVRSRPRERSTYHSRSFPRPPDLAGKRSVRSSLAENVTNSAQQEEMCKIHQMPRERSGARWTPLLSGGESHQFCIRGSRKCAKSAKWAIYLTVLVFNSLSIGRILHISSCLQCRIGQIPVDTNIHTDREKIQEAN